MSAVDTATPGLVRHDAPDTSRDAAQRVMPATGSQRRKVLDKIVARGEFGATDIELQALLDMGGSSQRPRRKELVDGGHIKDSGRRRGGCIVWVAS